MKLEEVDIDSIKPIKTILEKSQWSLFKKL